MEFTSLRGRQATNSQIRSQKGQNESKRVIVPWEKEDNKARGIGNVDKWAHLFKKLSQGETCSEDLHQSLKLEKLGISFH